MPRRLSFRAPARVGAGLPYVGLIVLGATSLAPAPALAQGAGLGNLLPGLGADARVGNLRPQLERFFQGEPSTARPSWLIQPGIDVQVGATDNAVRSASAPRADVFTIITPQIALSGDTPRLKLNLSYAPQVTEYASTASQNRISQYGNATSLLTVVPDLFFIDMRGSITQQSLTTGGFNQGQVQSYNQQNDVQTATVSINPYLERSFGGWGMGRVGYTYNRTLQDLQSNQNQNSLLNNQNTFGTPAYGTTGNLTTQTERAFYSSGENLGRFNDQVVIQATQYAGGASYVGAHRNEASNQLSFAVDHTFTLLASYGYQDVRYGGTPGVRINQPSYSAGFRYAPNPDTSVTLQYGKQDGQANLSLDSQVALTARIRLIARYSTGVTTDLEQSQNQLNNTSVGANGALTDRTSGAPVSGVNGFSGLQNGVYRVKRFSAEVLFLQDRDSYDLSLTNENRTSLTSSPTLLGNGVVPSGTSTTSTYGTVTWQHDLAPDMSTNVALQYGVTSNTSQFVSGGGNGGSGDQTTLSFSASINKQFSQTLGASLRYTYTDQSGGQVLTTNGFNSGTYSSNIALLSLHKSF